MSEFKVTITKMTPDSFLVWVKQLKFDTIRQETYWASPKGLSKAFATKEKAESYAAQFR